MIIFPAIDIKGGKCVRLLKGDFNKITQYEKSPIDQANEFSNLGFNNIHLVDLDHKALGRGVSICSCLISAAARLLSIALRWLLVRLSFRPLRR